MSVKDILALAGEITSKKAPLKESSKLFQMCMALDEPGELAVALRSLFNVVAMSMALQKPYLDLLRQLVNCDTPSMQVFAIRMSLETLKLGGEDNKPLISATGSCAFSTLIEEILLSPKWTDELANALVEMMVPFFDLRVCGTAAIAAVAEQLGAERSGAKAQGKKRKRCATNFGERIEASNFTVETICGRLYELLRSMPGPMPVGKEVTDSEGPFWLPTEQIERDEKLREERRYRRAFQGAWVKLLLLPLPQPVLVGCLQHLPAHVLPHLGSPLSLASFYLNAFDRGEIASSVLALSGLFYLLTKHGLGDMETVGNCSHAFYSRLYKIISPEVFQLKYRVRFLRLMNMALRSTLLPAGYVTAFVKKCARIAVVTTSAPASMWLLVLIYGLMQRHKAHCDKLLHRPAQEALNFTKDPWEFSAELEASAKTAGKTSLWELDLLKKHYCPSVVRLASLFQTEFTKPIGRTVDHEDFLDLSFDKLISTEMTNSTRKIAKHPSAIAFASAHSDNDVLADLAFEEPVKA